MMGGVGGGYSVDGLLVKFYGYIPINGGVFSYGGYKIKLFGRMGVHYWWALRTK